MTHALARGAGIAAAAAALAAVLATLATRATPPAVPPSSALPEAPAAATAAPQDPAEWHEKARAPDVSAGVLVRVASRRPLDRDLACAPAAPEGAGAKAAPEEDVAADMARCTPGVDEIEAVEVDWNGTKPSP